MTKQIVPEQKTRSQTSSSQPLNIAVVIPVLNEASTIQKVISDFRHHLPGCQIYVIDNGSADRSTTLAEEAGASVLFEKRRGKGYVIQTILEQIDTDIYILVDGDDTYPAEEAAKLLTPVLAGRADMVIGTRLEQADGSALRSLHYFGNRLITYLLNRCFGTQFVDVLSGYRVFTREFARKTPVVTSGFEIETELTIRALEMGMVLKEVPIKYQVRPTGSTSKLRTFRDGYRIILTIAVLLRDHRPLYFFSLLASVSALGGIGIGALSFWKHFDPAHELKIALAATMLLLLSPLLLITGLILNAINTRFKELVLTTSRKVHQRR